MTQPVTGPASYFPSIEKKYGQPISYWLDLIASSGLTKHKALVDWLKAEYGVDLTQETKRKILGLNAARLYGIDPAEHLTKISNDALAQQARQTHVA